MATRGTHAAPKIESLLSSRLFLAPQLVGDRLFFISNLAGALSLYVMDREGSVPEPLFPPDIALQNPELMEGYSFSVFPSLGQIVVMLDADGNELYQPMVVPTEGGVPERLVEGLPAGSRVYMTLADVEQGIAYQAVANADQPFYEAYRNDVLLV